MYMPHCIYPFILLWLEVWVDSTFWLLWMMLLWTWGYKDLFKTLLSGVCGITRSSVILHLIFWEYLLRSTIVLALLWFPGIHNFNRTTSWLWWAHGVVEELVILSRYCGQGISTGQEAESVKASKKLFSSPTFNMKKLRYRNQKLLA